MDMVSVTTHKFLKNRSTQVIDVLTAYLYRPLAIYKMSKDVEHG